MSDLDFLDGRFPRRTVDIDEQPLITNVQILGGPPVNFQNPDEPYPFPKHSNDLMNITPLQQIHQLPPPMKNYLAMNCIDIAHHLTECPVCSKLHKSHSPYFIGAIVFLMIIILFLGKRFFE